MSTVNMPWFNITLSTAWCFLLFLCGNIVIIIIIENIKQRKIPDCVGKSELQHIFKKYYYCSKRNYHWLTRPM